MNRRARLPRRQRPPPRRSSATFIPRECPESFLGPLAPVVHDLAPAIMAMGLADTMLVLAVLYTDAAPWIGTATADQMGPGEAVARDALERARARGGVAVLCLLDDEQRLILLTPPPASRAA